MYGTKFSDEIFLGKSQIMGNLQYRVSEAIGIRLTVVRVTMAMCADRILVGIPTTLRRTPCA